MLKRVFTLIVCLVLLLSLPGCWNRRELNTLAIVQAIGIDKTEKNDILLTVQILIPSAIKGSSPSEGGSGADKGVWTLTTEGETIFDAFRNATLASERKLFVSHNKVLVIGEEVAKSGLKPIIDFFHRDPEARHTVKMFIAHGRAKEIIEGEHFQEKIPASAIEGLAKVSAATSKIPEREFTDFVKMIDSRTSDPVLPGIKITIERKKEEDKNVVQLDKTAIFDAAKLIGWFDEKETRGLLWVLDEVKSGIIVVHSPQEENKKVSLEIINASIKVIPEITEDGELEVTIEVTVDGNLAEQMSQVNLTRPANFKELENRQAAVIEQEIFTTLQKAQAWGVDIFKFGEAFHRKYPEEWPQLEVNWSEEFSKIKAHLVIDAKLRRVGITTTPILLNEEEPEGEHD